jgi:membrane-bound lytic murein transglycosylase A
MRYLLLAIPLFFTSCSFKFFEKEYKRESVDDIIDRKFPPQSFTIELLEVEYSEIDGWNFDNQKESLKAFVRGCEKGREASDIEEICERGTELYKKRVSLYTIKKFFENNFTPYLVIDRAKGKLSGTVTGYYVPLLKGSRHRTSKYKYPIYAKPRDFRKPYLTHAEIDSRRIDAQVICWVEDRVDRLYLHIQGSGMVKLTDGSVIGIGYAEQNGYKFRSVGSYINKKYGVPLYRLSAEFIKNWIKKYPDRADEVLHHNQSFIFFVEQGKMRAIGALGTNLVPKSTIAIDRKFVPLGMPIFIQSENKRDPVLNHLFMAQDTGGAIKGSIRADLFYGFGDRAGEEAGSTKREGTFFMLVPNGYDIEDFLDK